MLTILSVIGTRPEAIKMAPVVGELGKHPGRVRSIVCATGQHREMLDRALGLFGIRPDYDLDAMRPGQGLAELTARLVSGLDGVVEEVRPDWVLAQGDTTSVLSAAMVAYYRKARFGHVEAGLRTGDKDRPFPEEVNRRFADLVADACFAPTEGAREALVREGVPEGRVHVTGNTVVDAVREVAGRAYDWSGGPLAELAGGRLVLVTAHRRESFGGPLREVARAVRELAGRFEGVRFVYPVHPNPNVRGAVGEELDGVPNVSLLEPLDYAALVHLMARCELVMTDSGGIQEEAPGLGVPVLVLRETTERPEGVEAGVARLVGTDRGRIVEEAGRILGDPGARAAMVGRGNPYGDGHAAGRIVGVLLGA